MPNRPFIAPLACLALTASILSGCAATLPSEPELVQRLGTAPPGAPPGKCWGKDISPAVVETVTEQIMLQPAEILTDGSIAQPAIYKTETHQRIVRERQETWFETPCPADLTPEFNASLQRALKARGHYTGPVNGKLDARTRAAIRAYQKAQGLDSGILSVAAARQLGLIAVPRDAL
ncbi:MAG: peptidoglycan-binding protein [Rhodobacteraceae bacterium]|jgi:hypothetical protein|nr:peptidoglycan-binding protein [Paracoccaceae bacterium]